MAKLTENEKARYARHIVLPEVGEAGQRKLLDSTVFVLGAGGLGSPVSLYLAAAGVGRLIICDNDSVELSNLQRQIIHRESEIGEPKAESARKTLADHTPAVKVEPLVERVTESNADKLFAGADVVVDCCDNFATRYVASDACVRLKIPFVHGAIFRHEGQASTFPAGGRPCYRCLYPEPPPPESVRPSSETGLLGVLPGTIGCIEAIEVIKLIVGFGEPLYGKLLLYEATSVEFRKLKFLAADDCPTCGERKQ